MTATVACLMTFSLAACGSSDEGKTAGVSGDIKVYTRDSSSGTREAFEKGVDFEGSLTKNAIEVSSNDDMAAKVGADKNGIGYTSLSTDFEKNGVSALQYEGVTASSESVLDGSYKLQRPFMYVTRAAGDYGSDDKEQLVQAFLDFMLSEDVQTLGRELIGKAPVRKGMENPEGSLAVEDRVNLITDAKVLYETREQDKEQFAEMFGF